MIIDYSIGDVAPYINWDYFFYAWGMHNKPEAEKLKLRGEAEETLATLQGHYHTHALFQLFEANSEDDDILIGHHRGFGNDMYWYDLEPAYRLRRQKEGVCGHALDIHG